MVRLKLAAALALLPLGSAAAIGPAPDLTVRRDGFERVGDSLRVVVQNLGDAASPATVLELSDRPFSGGPTGTSSHYRPVPGMHAMWLDQEPEGKDALRLRLSIGRGLDPWKSTGEIRFRDTDRVRLETPVPGVTVDGSGPTVQWSLDVPAEGVEILFRVDARPGRPPQMRLTVPPAGKLPPPVYTWDARKRQGVIDLSLDCLDRPAAHRLRVPVPALGPGERTTLTAAFAGGALGEVSAAVDPDDEIAEIREGNNISTRAADSDHWSLSALHVHSCFSEGPGSFDWQAWQAARSGYDLVWWSEHDWRVACRDHLSEFGFEDEDPINVDFDVKGEGSRAERTRTEVSSGSRALLLATGPDGGTSRARVRSDRKRLAYTLASQVRISMRVLARDLQAGDVLTVGFDLSYHPSGARSLVYRLRWGGSDEESGDAGSPWAPEIPRALPTGGWVTVEFPVSDDAAARWWNGLDDNLIGVWFELQAAGPAEVRVDDVSVRHEHCGMDLIRTEDEWTRSYPNLAHQVGGEISYIAPHLIRFGGDPALLLYDLEREREEGQSETEEAAETIRVVHAQGGLASWAHPLGVNRIGSSDPDAIVARIGDDLAGADALEVGYRSRGGKSLADHFALWDSLSARGVVVTALGVNDSHYNQWSPSENDFGTWLESPADDQGSLLRALSSGRAFFGDPVLFRGRFALDLGGVPMGGIVGDGPRSARIRFTDIGDDRTVRLIGDGEVLREWKGISGSGVLSEQLSAGQARTVRAELWAADGAPLAFTNPVFVDPDGTLHRGHE